MRCNLEQIKMYKLSSDILFQVVNKAWEENIEIDFENLDFKVIINNIEVENPLKYIEKINKLIDYHIDEADKITEKEAKKLLKEKYENLEQECFELTNKINELKESVESKISWN